MFSCLQSESSLFAICKLRHTLESQIFVTFHTQIFKENLFAYKKLNKREEFKICYRLT